MAVRGGRMARPREGRRKILGEDREVLGALAALGSPAAAGLFRRRPNLVLLRPEDHLVLTVSAVGLRTIMGEDGIARLVAEEGASPNRLVIGFPPQHVAEQVFQENDQAGNPEQPALPAGARFAGPSRLAFEVAADEAIELTTAGILEAMARLPLAVVPLAAPRKVWYLWEAQAAALPANAIVVANAVLAPSGGPRGGAIAAERVRATRVLAASGLGSAVRSLEPETRRAVLALPASERNAAVVGIKGSIDVTAGGIGRFLRNPDPRPPRADETAIEVPSRLQLSPSIQGGWAHAVSVDDERGDGSGPIELWHSRLGVRDVAADGTVTVDENDAVHRIVRGVWTRDLASWTTTPAFPTPPVPFAQSTRPRDRWGIVGLSSGAGQPTWASPNPVDVNRLALSSLGAFIDVRGAWPFTPPYSLAEWQHRTTLGRDQYVKVVEYGYLYPFGHRAVFVSETRRKVDPTLPRSADTAILWQRKFVVLRERTKVNDDRDMPFTSITLAPHTTPDLDNPGDDPAYFWPSVDGAPFRFTVSAIDHDGSTHVFTAPLIWIRAPMDLGLAGTILGAYGLAKDAQGFRHVAGPGDARLELDLAGRRVAVAPSGPSGEAAYETRALRFAADPQGDTSTPTLLFADLIVPAVAATTGKRDPLRLAYAAPYLTSAFDENLNKGEVLLQTARDAAAGALSFAGSTDRSGGFLDPAQAIDGISRRLGPVADVANTALGTVAPAQLFAGLGKLFGLFELDKILQQLGLGDMPAYAAQVLDIAGALDGDLTKLPDLLPDAPPQMAAAKTALKDAAAAYDALRASVPPDLPTAEAQFTALINTQLQPALNQAQAVLGDLERAQQAIVGRTLETLNTILTPPPPLPAAGEMLARLARGEPVAGLLNHVHLEWSPPLQEWPAGAPIFKPSLDGQAGALLLAVDVRGGDLAGTPSAAVVAQLTNFTLQLLPGFPLLGIGFQRLLFKATTGSKTEVDVVLDGLEWQGILGFVETLKDLIPLDGFSDPPNIEVDSSGISAGFSIALPNLAVGVFNLSNLSLGADLKLPFIGDAPTVGFNFCTRERPFTLAVMFLGGGGFFGLRLNPQGLVLLEASLEFGAVLALDFVVASGSVSCMAGIYFRLEAKDGSLTGYVRIRGEVDVLGLISASLEMYMGLTYEFGSGKVVGRATITIEVEVLFFSESVSVSCERKFAGSSGDPTFADAMGPYAPGGPWVAYCQAFAQV